MYIFEFSSEKSFTLIDGSYWTSISDNTKELTTYQLSKGTVTSFELQDMKEDVTVKYYSADPLSVSDYGVYTLNGDNDDPYFLFRAPSTGVYVFEVESDSSYTLFAEKIISEPNAVNPSHNQCKTALVYEYNKGESMIFRFCDVSDDIRITVSDTLRGNYDIPVAVGEDMPSYSYRDHTLTVYRQGAIDFNVADPFFSGIYLELYYLDPYLIKNVELNDGATSIGYHAFHEMSSLERVYIPASVTSIDDKAFTYTSGGWYYDDEVNDYVEIPQEEKLLEKLTIVGYKGSYAETYAKEHGIPFEEITLRNISCLSKNAIHSGESVTVNCSSIGGSEPYTYAVYYRQALFRKAC